MTTYILWIEIIFFACMGGVALFKPSIVTGIFGQQKTGPDMRNEVRAVYGGFGLAIAAVLGSCFYLAAYQAGILLTVSAALLGMAFGRVISRLVERTDGWYPWLFFFVECTLGFGLLFVLKEGGV
ncbi:MAG: DUF4345 domain-containing protein [Pseudomonadota bacterium]